MSVSAKVVGLSSCDLPWAYDTTRRAERIVEAIYWFIIELAMEDKGWYVRESYLLLYVVEIMRV